MVTYKNTSKMLTAIHKQYKGISRFSLDIEETIKKTDGIYMIEKVVKDAISLRLFINNHPNGFFTRNGCRMRVSELEHIPIFDGYIAIRITGTIEIIKK